MTTIEQRYMSEDAALIASALEQNMKHGQAVYDAIVAARKLKVWEASALRQQVYKLIQA